MNHLHGKMNPIIATIKASRWQNLLIVALTMVLVRMALIQPFFKILIEDSSVDFARGMGDLDFTLLVISSLLIAAAGNLINDYFDIKIDRVNKPDKIIVGRYLKRRVAMMLHLVFNGIAVLIAGYLAYKAGKIELAFIQIILVATLWFYSIDFKRRLIWGNLSIAFCVALVPIVVWVFEILTMITVNNELFEEQAAKAIFKEFSEVTLAWVLGLSLFSFLLTIGREIIKDIVDIKGDLAFHCKSLPIVLGIQKSKMIASAFHAIVIALAIYVQQVYLPDKGTLFYVFVIITPLLGAAIVTTVKAQEPHQFKLPSLLNKLASLAGVLYLVMVYYILNQF